VAASNPERDLDELEQKPVRLVLWAYLLRVLAHHSDHPSSSAWEAQPPPKAAFFVRQVSRHAEAAQLTVAWVQPWEVQVLSEGSEEGSEEDWSGR
jgi:hypothetical protein